MTRSVWEIFMPEDILIPTRREHPVDTGLDNFDNLAWQLAIVLCRRCWHPWWRHGHGPFKTLIEAPSPHLFDAL
jgi:hypothetical protein